MVFGQGKTVEQVVAIAEKLASHADGFLVTRAEPAKNAIGSLARTKFVVPPEVLASLRALARRDLRTADL